MAAAKEITPIKPADFMTESGLYQSRHLAVIDPSSYPDILTNCKYFALIENRLSAFDRIELRFRDNTAVVDAIISEIIQKSWIQLREVSKTMLRDKPTDEPVASGDWAVHFVGGSSHWAIIDPLGRVARDGFLSKQNAEQEVQVRKAGAPLNTLSGR